MTHMLNIKTPCMVENNQKLYHLSYTYYLHIKPPSHCRKYQKKKKNSPHKTHVVGKYS